MAATGGSSAAAYRKLSENLERLRTDLFSSVSPWPAVFLAVETGDESMLRFLMSRLRLSGEEMLPGGTTTPLMKAVASRSVPLADILVSCRELLNAVDARGRTALDMALERGDGEMAALLRRHGGITGEERKKEREHSSPSSPPAYDLAGAGNVFQNWCGRSFPAGFLLEGEWFLLMPPYLPGAWLSGIFRRVQGLEEVPMVSGVQQRVQDGDKTNGRKFCHS